MSNDTATAIPTPAAQAEHQSPPSVGLDPGYLEPPADPSGYEIAWRDPATGEPIAELGPELQQVDADVKAWAHIAGVPGTELSALADLVQMQGEAGQSPEQCTKFLHAKWGGDFEENVQRAREFVNSVEARKPGLKDFLVRSGLGDSPRFIMAVERLARSAGRRK